MENKFDISEDQFVLETEDSRIAAIAVGAGSFFLGTLPFGSDIYRLIGGICSSTATCAAIDRVFPEKKRDMKSVEFTDEISASDLPDEAILLRNGA